MLMRRLYARNFRNKHIFERKILSKIQYSESDKEPSLTVIFIHSFPFNCYFWNVQKARKVAHIIAQVSKNISKKTIIYCKMNNLIFKVLLQ
jgi:hypothetical protein